MIQNRVQNGSIVHISSIVAKVNLSIIHFGKSVGSCSDMLAFAKPILYCKCCLLDRDVKRRSNFRTSNYMFEFEFGIITFDIRLYLAPT